MAHSYSKTFFRRTIVTKRTFKCHKNGDCQFNKEHRCACRSCRFNKCLQVGMNPNAIQASRHVLVSSPVSVSSINSETCNRKRGYDISSLLDIPSASSTMTSRSTTPTDVAVQCPFRTKSCQKELAEQAAKLVSIEERLSCLRKSTYKPTGDFVELLTSPSALETTRLFELRPSPSHLNWDEEMCLAAEYAKAFPWFQEMQLEEKLVLLVRRVFHVAAMHVAAEFSKTDSGSIECLRSTISSFRRLALDPISFALLNAIVFTDCASSHFCDRTNATLREQREKNVDALGLYLFERYQSEGASRIADHLSLIWSLLNDCCTLRKHLLDTLSPTSLTANILQLHTRFS
ncbi:hypothetical protein Q1695_000250 [Nippostrongylus brasiliensis]|nr:hypothetical protein Q1695_000250 [Nippostrongylus brasiliensis]